LLLLDLHFKEWRRQGSTRTDQRISWLAESAGVCGSDSRWEHGEEDGHDGRAERATRTVQGQKKICFTFKGGRCSDQADQTTFRAFVWKSAEYKCSQRRTCFRRKTMRRMRKKSLSLSLSLSIALIVFKSIEIQFLSGATKERVSERWF
jgi:hypothetical protein